MAHSQEQPLAESIRLGGGHRPLLIGALGAGLAGLVVAVLAANATDLGIRRFYFAYLTAFAFFLSLALGGLVFVLLQHLTRAGWSVNIRRVAESLAWTLPLLAALAVPIVITVVAGRGELYVWAQPVPENLHHDDAHHEPHHAQPAGKVKGEEDLRFTRAYDELTHKKRPFLNAPFFLARLVVYFAVWIGLAWYFRSRSIQQDESGDPALSSRMSAMAAPGLVALALTVTFGAIDLFMSLDPHWFSTIFGVYFFAGGKMAFFAAMVVAITLLRSRGHLRGSVTTEHMHDLGKWLFAFVFFWGYIAFSQYMLLWYASLPETTGWLLRRGAESLAGVDNPWTQISIALAVGHMLVPFAGLLSRHVKRAAGLLVGWSVWLLFMHYLDVFWLIMPELDGGVHFGIPEVAAMIGIGGLFVAVVVRNLAAASLRPVRDPRAVESLAFQNI